ncbi:TetR family transcriptional regulator [Metallumcola ferriviriculae]|uniref:TetR family transcriptional regulator n=1 Tax=Metallumcola ferriviriculae TaxID=3039180 RepID=A0AAU0UN43_9FIRM|nr:TetR family transcriptional regulator [Desulfitibacteraceae bacterium MK1]
MEEKRGGQKYDAILQAAVKVFAQKGFHRSRVSQIAEQAGIGDGTVYLYFHNKEDILVSLFQERMTDFVYHLRRRLEHTTTFYDTLKILIHYHFEVMEFNPDQAIVTQFELRQQNADINEGISPYLRKYFRIIEEVVDRGKKQGFVKQDIPTVVARKMIFGTIDEVVTDWVNCNCTDFLKEMTEIVYQLLIYGLLDSKASERGNL